MEVAETKKSEHTADKAFDKDHGPEVKEKPGKSDLALSVCKALSIQ